MAAISLRQEGYAVRVIEARPSHDLHSDGILGITNENWLDMQYAGVRLARFQLPVSTVTDGLTGITTMSPYQYITWTDLHLALTERATDLGALFSYGEEITADPTGYDVIVRATGIGSAHEVSRPAYTGYVVVRGLAYQFAGTPWTQLSGTNENSGRWHFLVGDTNDGASVTMFVQREHVQFKTTYTAVAPGEILNLPIRYRRLMETVPIFQIAPLSDWEVPMQMVYKNTIRIGDANGQLRPATSMGANLAIREALSIPGLIDGSVNEFGLVSERQYQHDIGMETDI
jgi:hypothetical protein